MRITSANVANYLIQRGLLRQEAVVDGDFMAVECSRRNRNFKIFSRNALSLFVKQIRNWDSQSIASLRCEATCYWLASSHTDAIALRDLVAGFHHYDSARHVLVTSLLNGSETIAEHHRRLVAFPPELGAALGRALGTYHSASARALETATGGSIFQRQVPWILTLHRQVANMSGAISGANAGLIQILQQYPAFQQGLDTLSTEWQTTNLIHGDMKWDNCLVDGDVGKVRIIDWELADIGDPSWDVGAVLQSYVSFWVLSLPLGQAADATQIARGAQYPLEKMQAAIRAFWIAYHDTRGLGRQDTALLERTIRFAAARMVLTAYETMQFSPHLSAHARYLLQVSLNMLLQPRDAARDLLSL
jgi:aminoglycoside phosphotransferase (APT) family kinase protein